MVALTQAKIWMGFNFSRSWILILRSNFVLWIFGRIPALYCLMHNQSTEPLSRKSCDNNSTQTISEFRETTPHTKLNYEPQIWVQTSCVFLKISCEA